MEMSSFCILYFGTIMFVRCLELSVVWNCPLIEVQLYDGF